jgi:hypothetical protein
MPPVPQIRRISFNDEEIGMGFDSQSGLAIGTALEGFTIQENPAAPGAEVSASISIINTHEELQEQLGMSFEAHGRYGFFSASAKAKFSESTKFNSTSTFLVARCVVQNPLRRGKSFKVTAEAKELLNTGDERFTTAFGDSFVRGLQTGGEFYAIIRITSVSTVTQTELGATLQAEMNGLVAGGSFQATFSRANSNASTRSEFTATMYQNAGAGGEISPTVSIEDVVKRFKEFPAIAKSSAAAYEAEIATYNTLPLPLPTPEEQEDFLAALADVREKKLRYIQTRNDLEFALRNPSFFDEPPASTVLTDAIGVYTKLINAAMAHAIKLSRGQISPPQLFDPGLLTPPITEPAPIPLNRKKTDADGLTLTANPHSFPVGFPRLEFDVPDSFEATTQVTILNFGGPVAPDFGDIQITRSPRQAGIGLLNADGVKLFAGALQITPEGEVVGKVSGNLAPQQMFSMVSTPYAGDVCHLKIVVQKRKVRQVLFSRDGVTFTNTKGHESLGSAVLPQPVKLVLFTWSMDDSPMTARFSQPAIVPIPDSDG